MFYSTQKKKGAFWTLSHLWMSFFIFVSVIYEMLQTESNVLKKNPQPSFRKE